MAHCTRATVKSADNGTVVINPTNTNYELALQCADNLKPGDDVSGFVRLQGRKIWTMAAGGAFIQPLFGPPRVVQGRVKTVEGNSITVQAGALVRIDLPREANGLDLKNGPIVPGAMVNATIMPGARFESIP